MRLAFFGLLACLLFWLGTLRPGVAPSGPGFVVVGQGSNVAFVPQSFGAATWSVTASTPTNAFAGPTNAP